MITDTAYKIAIAGFLHDIGKFVERANDDFVSKDFKERHLGLYCPYNNRQKRHTHQHAIYTAAFIDYIEKWLPQIFNKGKWGLGDSFFNLASGHHKPETPMQWIIALGDRIASGFERDEFENYNKEEDDKEIKIKDFKKTRLLTIFEQISIRDNWLKDTIDSYLFRYPLKELSLQNIFPEKFDKSAICESDYKDLFDKFIFSLEKLEHKDCIPLWFEHFESCFMIYASHIPAATVGYTIPDVSLFDHSKTTAALSVALYLYHSEKNTLNDIEKIKDYSEKKFLIINGDFYGIQDFIFSEGGITNKKSAKLLRGRSFVVSLFSELAADMLCREIGLPSVSIILNAAGKFTIIAPNTDRTIKIMYKVEDKINNWLIENFYGELAIGISSTEVSPDDLISKNLSTLWEKISQKLEEKKFNKINLDKYGGPINSYLSSFKKDISKPLCPFCGKRPSSSKDELSDNEPICSICHDHIYIGTNLVKKNKLAITKKDANLYGDKLSEPIYGEYQLSFDIEGKLTELVKDGSLLKYWDISISKEGILSKNITSKFINGYVPKFSKENETEELERILYGQKSEKKKEELLNMIINDKPKLFTHIAKWALNKTENKSDKFTGIEALGVLKADVDNMGSIFYKGLPKERQNLSKLATLSRQMNNYFSLHLPYILDREDNFKNIYTIFAGGDDLFLIGPWNKIIEFAKYLNESFSRYVCGNKEITISAGISIHKPYEPVRSFYDYSKNALEMSKKTEGKNSITLFGETVNWNQFAELEKIREQLENLFDKDIINNAMLFRLLNLSEKAEKEKEILEKLEKQTIELKDIELACLKWRAMLYYTAVRNVGKRLKEEEKIKVIEGIIHKFVSWIDKYKSAIKIPVCQILYNKRGG